MQRLSDAIHNWVNRSRRHVIFSSYKTPGEGEQKIMQWMRSNPSALGDEAYVYSNDGDFLILLSQVFSSNTAFWLLSDVDKSSNPAIAKYDSTYYAIDVQAYYRRLIGSIRAMSQKDLEVSDQSLLHDFMFYMSLCGNDFVKPVPWLRCRVPGAMEFMARTYGRLLEKHKSNLVIVLKGGYVLNEAFFIDLVRAIVRYEPKRMQETCNRIFECIFNGARPKRQAGLLETIEHVEFYYKCHPLHGFYQSTYRYLFDTRDDHATRKKKYYNAFLSSHRQRGDMMANYLESILWTFQYYMFGVSSWDWFYRYPVAPLPSDFLDYLCGLGRGEIKMCMPVDRSGPVRPFAQLALVLPRCAHDLLPGDIKKKLADSGWNWFYPGADDICLYGVDEHKYIYSEPKVAHWTDRAFRAIRGICSKSSDVKNRLCRRVYSKHGRDHTNVGKRSH